MVFHEVFLEISNIGLYSGLGGFVILFIIIWILIKRHKSGRLSLEEREIGEDKYLLNIDRKARTKEKEEKILAREFDGVLFKIINRARALGLNDFVGNNKRYLYYAHDILVKIIEEVISLRKEEEIMQKLTAAINIFLGNLHSTDKKLNGLIAEARELQKALNLDIEEEAELLKKKEGLLRQEFMETRQEEAA